MKKYHDDKESQKSELNNLTGEIYPITYNEFKDKIIELYVDVARKKWGDSREVALSDLEKYFKEYDTDRLKSEYIDCCEWYDKSKRGETGMPPENVFGAAHLDSSYVAIIEMYIEFFG